ncbi:MAG TPA: hypothetical protein VMU82_14785 [Acetobacteraceae bacterium]|nr:hypothetical protein [Acetobacteraceae bacterium]
MGSDAYLQISFPGMSPWHVERVLGEEGVVIGYQITRTQIAAMTMPGIGNEHKLDDIRQSFEKRAKFLNDTAEPLVLPKIG